MRLRIARVCRPTVPLLQLLTPMRSEQYAVLVTVLLTVSYAVV